MTEYYAASKRLEIGSRKKKEKRKPNSAIKPRLRRDEADQVKQRRRRRRRRRNRRRQRGAEHQHHRRPLWQYIS
uniref:Uncharacterized protein n=1 Tax=Oryza nivara TaxID=4536 RepID=A0A0E0FX33_ORYNI